MPTGNDYADTGLPPGTTYYYRVFANNVDGNSPFSNAASAATAAAEPPATPGGFTATPAGTNQINLTWVYTATNEDGFNVERSLDGSNYATIAMPAAGVTNYADIGLTAGERLIITCSGVPVVLGQFGFFRPSQCGHPGAYSARHAHRSGGRAWEWKINLSWLTTTGAVSYNIKRAPVSGGSDVTLTSQSKTSYTDSGVVNGTTYYYVVSAVNAGGEGNDSSEVAPRRRRLPRRIGRISLPARRKAGIQTPTGPM